jgi:hypothetical protein
MASQKWRHGPKDLGEEDFYEGRAHWHGYGRPALDLPRTLGPLIAHLKSYDAHRQALQAQGGEFRDLKRLTEILRREVSIAGPYRERRVSLVDQAGLKAMLREVGDFDVHLEVRQLETRLPVYYLCRLGRYYFSAYDQVLEDLHVSPGYPLTDSRFVKLMRHGHEVYHLRLSIFRERAGDILGGDKAWAVDDWLSQVGRLIFQAAWHEDQRLGVMVARHFGLPHFQQAIEVLYLCLSGELCEIRSAADDQLLRFFREVYPQPALHGFLELLLRLEGGALTALTQEALHLYTRLSQAFNRFLSVPVGWGFRQESLPLMKLIFGNFSRLPQVSAPLVNNPEVSAAKEVLEHEAGGVVAALLRGTPVQEQERVCAWAG